MELMKQILLNENVVKALDYMEKKKKDTAAGVDNMQVPELRGHLRENWIEIKTSLLNGTYKPKPVRRKEIPKGKNKVRVLGIPTVLDRFIQQAVIQKIDKIFDKDFSDNSYGFRKGRNQHMAVKRAREIIQSGYIWVVDMDLSKFFNRVNHDILMSKVAKKIKDKSLLRLIRRYLEAGMMENGVKTATEEGTPQGGVISPLLSNIMLDELDKELEKRGHKFVRYADDFQVYVKSKRAAQRVMKSIRRFIENRLKLKVNEEKSSIKTYKDVNFLGFGFYKRNNQTRVRISKESLKKFKNKIRDKTSRSKPISMEKRIKNINRYTKGWIEYFKLADIKSHMKRLSGWIRRRLSMCLWKFWKNIKTRIRNLIKLGVDEIGAITAGISRKGYWRLTKSYQIKVALGKKYWSNYGYKDLVNIYLDKR